MRYLLALAALLTYAEPAYASTQTCTNATNSCRNTDSSVEFSKDGGEVTARALNCENSATPGNLIEEAVISFCDGTKEKFLNLNVNELHKSFNKAISNVTVRMGCDQDEYPRDCSPPVLECSKFTVSEADDRHILWLSGGVRYKEYNNSLNAHYINGRLLLSGEITLPSTNEVMNLDTSFDYATPFTPAGSPKDAPSGADTTDWLYFGKAATTDKFTFEQELANGHSVHIGKAGNCDLYQMGAAPQLGAGAGIHGDASKYGFATWLWKVCTDEKTGQIKSITKGDINVWLECVPSTPTPTPTSTFTHTATATATLTATATSTPTYTATHTATATPTFTLTPPPLPSSTPTKSPTPTITPTATIPATPTETPEPTLTLPPEPTGTITISGTPVPEGCTPNSVYTEVDQYELLKKGKKLARKAKRYAKKAETCGASRYEVNGIKKGTNKIFSRYKKQVYQLVTEVFLCPDECVITTNKGYLKKLERAARRLYKGYTAKAQYLARRYCGSTSSVGVGASGSRATAPERKTHLELLALQEEISKCKTEVCG